LCSVYVLVYLVSVQAKRLAAKNASEITNTYFMFGGMQQNFNSVNLSQCSVPQCDVSSPVWYDGFD